METGVVSVISDVDDDPAEIETAPEYPAFVRQDYTSHVECKPISWLISQRRSIPFRETKTSFVRLSK